ARPPRLLSARGPSEPPVSVTDGQENVLFFNFFLLGSLVEETPCEHGENMQTPHRKAREIAHLSTVHPGEDLPPGANSAPCGNRTHDLLAVRRQCKQCKQLSHRDTVTAYNEHTHSNSSNVEFKNIPSTLTFAEPDASP